MRKIGRQKVAQTFLSAHHFSYDSATLALTNETVIAHGATNTIARAQDNLGRPSGIDLGQDYSLSYAYNGLGQFHKELHFLKLSV